jgi:hypothetical protein
MAKQIKKKLINQYSRDTYMIKLKVAVIEERVNNLSKQNCADHKEIIEAIGQINQSLTRAYVTKSEFEPYKRVIIGTISIVATALLLYAVKQIYNM